MQEKLDLGQTDNTKKPSFFQQHKFMSILICCLTVAVIAFKFTETKVQQNAQKKQQELQTEKNKAFSEPHSKMEWILSNTATEESLEAAARLIAHTMETGCSTSYQALQKNFDQESLEYLQDFLLARPCEEYKTPPVTCIEIKDYERSYLVRLGSKKERYVITMKHHNYVVSSFIIKLYVEQNKIQ